MDVDLIGDFDTNGQTVLCGLGLQLESRERRVSEIIFHAKETLRLISAKYHPNLVSCLQRQNHAISDGIVLIVPAGIVGAEYCCFMLAILDQVDEEMRMGQ